MTKAFRSVRSFTEIAALIGEESAVASDSFLAAFETDLDGVRVSRDDEERTGQMPDATQVQLAVELIVTTLFDVLRDSRLEKVAGRIAWGIVHSFHRVSDQATGQADGAARQMRDLLRQADGSEIPCCRA